MSEVVPGDHWRRLHPLSPLVRFGRVVVGLLVLSVPSLQATHPHDRSWLNPSLISYAVHLATATRRPGPEQRAGDEEAQREHHQRRQGPLRDRDREIRRSPDNVDGPECCRELH